MAQWGLHISALTQFLYCSYFVQSEIWLLQISLITLKVPILFHFSLDALLSRVLWELNNPTGTKLKLSIKSSERKGPMVTQAPFRAYYGSSGIIPKLFIKYTL